MSNISDDKIDLRRIINAAKRCKWVYIATFVVLMTGSIYFALTRESKYELYSILLIESDQGPNAGALLGGAGGSQLMSMLSMSGFGSASIDNEMMVLYSNSVLHKVVKKVGLNCKYFLNKGFMHKETLYGNSPVLVETNDGYYDTLTKPLQFKIELKKNGKADVKVVRGFFSTLYDESDVDLPATVKVDGALFTLMPTDCYAKGEPLKMNVFIYDFPRAIEDLTKALTVDTYDKKSDAVLLSFADPCLQRGKDVLNSLADAYKEHRLKGKADRADLGIEFMDRQLESAYKSLVQSEAAMESFKEANKVTDISIELEVMLDAASKLNESMLAAKAQDMMCDLMLMYLNNEDSKYSLLPSLDSQGASTTGSETSMASGEASAGGNTLAAQYNALVLQRMRLLRSAKPDNRALAEVTENIDAMRVAVVESVKQQKKNIEAGMSVLDGQYNEFASRLGSTPRLEREYVILARDLELDNQIYLFLLGKKMDYLLSKEESSVPATVIDKAYVAESKPSNLKSIVFPIIGLFLSFVFPTLFVFWWLRRHKEVYKDYDMPASVSKSAIYDNMANLRAAILVKGMPKLFSIAYGSSSVESLADALRAAIAELSRQVNRAGRRVLLVDLCNLLDGECQLNGLSSASAVKPSAIDGADYVGYDAGTAGDILLNDRFAAMLSSMSAEYDSIMLLYRYSEDAASASAGLEDSGDMLTVYMVKSGITERPEIDGVANASVNRKMAYYIY